MIGVIDPIPVDYRLPRQSIDINFGIDITEDNYKQLRFRKVSVFR
jgi:hypothetical protein